MIKDSYLEFITKTGVLDKVRRDILRPGSVKGVHLDESARNWNNIVNKPSVFPPESHSHIRADISDLWNTPFWDNIQDKPSTFPPSAHNHPRSEIFDFWGSPFWDNIPDKPSIGIADKNILQVDQASGLTTGNLVRATSSGLESRTDAEILAQLSGKASAAFDWNGQDLTDVNNIEIGGMLIKRFYGFKVPIRNWGTEPYIHLNNSLAFADKKWTVTVTPSPSSGDSSNMFRRSLSSFARWSSPTGNIVIEIDFGKTIHYWRLIGFFCTFSRYPDNYKIEVYKTDSSSWKTLAEVSDSSNTSDWICVKCAETYVGKIKITLSGYSNNPHSDIDIGQIFGVAGEEIDGYVLDREGDTMYGSFDIQAQLRCDSFRIDQTPTAGTFTPDKYIVISCDGTDYKIPVKAV
ncbi:MAG: hypothetical protein J7L26_12555 [Candidatus Aminicenantes bacterium]|nr:hypothetical protein [Candidatus Aminicenantes bacterium]